MTFLLVLEVVSKGSPCRDLKLPLALYSLERCIYSCKYGSRVMGILVSGRNSVEDGKQ